MSWFNNYALSKKVVDSLWSVRSLFMKAGTVFLLIATLLSSAPQVFADDTAAPADQQAVNQVSDTAVPADATASNQTQTESPAGEQTTVDQTEPNQTTAQSADQTPSDVTSPENQNTSAFAQKVLTAVQNAANSQSIAPDQNPGNDSQTQSAPVCVPVLPDTNTAQSSDPSVTQPQSTDEQTGAAGNPADQTTTPDQQVQSSDQQVVEPTADPSVPVDQNAESQAPAQPNCAPFAATSVPNPVTTQNITDNHIEVINTNDAKVVNEAGSHNNTGANVIESEKPSAGGTIASGDINVFANVLTVVNTSKVNSEIVAMAQNFDSLSSSLVLDNPNATPQQITQDLVSQVCTDIECKSLNSFTLTNKNVADVENNVDVTGRSGDNQLRNVEADGTIHSGNVNAVVNVLNIVNTNLYNSRWTIAAINIFGDWNGDLVLPSELYFTDGMSIGATDSSTVDISQVKKVVFNIKNSNDVAIDNNVATDSDTGNNAINSTGDPSAKSGAQSGSDIETGDGAAISNVNNYLNTNIINSRWYLGVVNVLGNWAGNVYSLPDQVALSASPNSLVFFSSTANPAAAQQVLADAVSPNTDPASDTTQTDESVEQVDITNDNAAAIHNNVNVGAYSGNNTLEADKLSDGKIQTGHALALANILNFANTNLINSDLYVGLINVFGNWQGDVHFGYPDLRVSETSAPESIPSTKDQPVNYGLRYSNDGDGVASGTQLQWHYDPTVLKVNTASGANYTEDQPGVLTFNLGRLDARTSADLQINAQTVADQIASKNVITFAAIASSVPELNQDNNQMTLTVPLRVVPAGTSSNNSNQTQTTTGSGSSTNSSASGSTGTSTNGNSGNAGSTSSGSQSSGTAGQQTGGSSTGTQTGSGSAIGSNNGGGSNQSSTGATGTQTQNTGAGTTNTDQTAAGQNQNADRTAAATDTTSGTDSTTSNSGANNNNSGNSYYSSSSFSTPSPHPVVRVFASNDTNGKQVKNGDKVEFKLVIENDSNDEVYNVVAYDIIKDPHNQTVTSKSFPIDTLGANEQIEIGYELAITGDADPGTYTETIYAEGITSQLQPVRSESNGVSYFTIQNPSLTPLSGAAAISGTQTASDQGTQSQNSGQSSAAQPAHEADQSGHSAAQSADQADSKSQTDVNTATVHPSSGLISGLQVGHASLLSQTNGQSSTVQTPEVKGAFTEISNPVITRKTIAKKQSSDSSTLLERIAEPAQAKAIDVPQWLTLMGDGRLPASSQSNHMVDIITIAFLMAFGYALASIKEKLKKAKNAIH